MQNLIESKKQTLNQTLGFKYTSKNIENLLRGLSQSRLNRYAKLVSNRQSQLHLYSWNSALSQALYVPLQGLEIITRNYFNGMLVNSFGIQWYENKKIEFEYMQEKYLVDAKATLINEKKIVTLDNIIASLSFGFWTGLLGPKYETKLWRNCLYHSFKNKPKPFVRKNTHCEFNLIRLLRNRIAHHEPILRVDLPQHYLRIIIAIPVIVEREYITRWGVFRGENRDSPL